MDSSEQIDADFVLSQLIGCDLFAGLSGQDIAFCARNASLMGFPRGSLLIRQGDDADCAFLIVEGTAEVLFEKADGSEDLIDILSGGDCVGDLAILLDQPRTANVRASRNCRAIRIERADFLELQERVPAFGLRLARMVAQRLRNTTRERVRARSVAGVTAIGLSRSAAITQVMEALDRAMASLAGPRVALATADMGDKQRLAGRLAEADVVLLIGDGETTPDGAAIAQVVDLVSDMRPRPPVHLVLCHRDRITPGSGRMWLPDAGLQGRHHVRLGGRGDVDRISRLVTGRATGLALGGGGARGFAHIGVFMALEEIGVPVDYVAGTSMGAIIGAQHAAGFSVREMIAATRRAYVDWRGLPDITFPSVALYSGRATARKLKAMFGERPIEDLPIPYFAVASDLRSAEAVVLDNGLVWQAARISCSIPGMLPPTERDGRLLVDGALLDNLPVEALRARCGGRVIASDVSVAVEFEKPPEPVSWQNSHRGPARPGIAQIMMRTAQLASIRDAREAGTPADLYLNPGLDDVGMSDFGRIEEIVARGAEHARTRLLGWEP